MLRPESLTMSGQQHHHLHQNLQHNHLPECILQEFAGLLVSGGKYNIHHSPILVQTWIHLEVAQAGGVMVTLMVMGTTTLLQIWF